MALANPGKPVHTRQHVSPSKPHDRGNHPSTVPDCGTKFQSRKDSFPPREHMIELRVQTTPAIQPEVRSTECILSIQKIVEPFARYSLRAILWDTPQLCLKNRSFQAEKKTVTHVDINSNHFESLEHKANVFEVCNLNMCCLVGSFSLQSQGLNHPKCCTARGLASIPAVGYTERQESQTFSDSENVPSQIYKIREVKSLS